MGPNVPSPCAAGLQRVSRGRLTTKTVSIRRVETMRQKRRAMSRRFVFLSLPLLLAYAPIDNALAGRGSGSQSKSAHSSSSYAISPRHHALGSDDISESYRSQ